MPHPVVASSEGLVEEEDDLRETQRFEPFVVPDLKRPVDVLAVDLADAVRRPVHDVDAPHVRIDAPVALLGLLQAHLVDVAKRNTDAVRRQRAAPPEVFDEMLALESLPDLENRAGPDVRVVRFDAPKDL